MAAVNGEVEGTGLGLTVVKQLLDLMGGRVEVESELNAGSVIKVELPRAADLHESILEEASHLDPDSAKISKDKGAVLYVEDNSSNLGLVEQILTFSPDEIKLVHTAFGAKATALAVEHLPAVILLDLNLPDMHGKEVLKQLKADERTRSIPVIVVSADAMSSQINELIDLRAVGYLTKPLHVQQFLDEIHKYLNK